MALNEAVLANLIADIYHLEMVAAFPTVVKGVEVIEVPREDGTMSYDVTLVRGPNEPDEASIRPMANAIAQAVIRHIKAHAEVNDTDAGAGGSWRIL